MDAIKKLLTKTEPEEEVPDLIKPEDLRRVIEKVEVIDSVDHDAIHSQLSEIAEEKAAARVTNKSDFKKRSEDKVDKSDKKGPAIEPFSSSDNPFGIPKKSIQDTDKAAKRMERNELKKFSELKIATSKQKMPAIPNADERFEGEKSTSKEEPEVEPVTPNNTIDIDETGSYDDNPKTLFDYMQ